QKLLIISRFWWVYRRRPLTNVSCGFCKPLGCLGLAMTTRRGSSSAQLTFSAFRKPISTTAFGNMSASTSPPPRLRHDLAERMSESNQGLPCFAHDDVHVAVQRGQQVQQALGGEADKAPGHELCGCGLFQAEQPRGLVGRD